MLYRLICFTALLCIAAQAQAALKIEITEGVEGALPIAVVPFGWEGAGLPPEESVTEIIASDLARSGRFRPIPERDLLARPHEGSQVNFQNWRILGADNLVVGKIRAAGIDNYIIQFQVFDVFKAAQLAGYNIPASKSDLRSVSHQISDIIYETLTGEPGAFNTRIAYITLVRQDNKPKFSLYVADADGYSPRIILQSPRELMSPSWSPDGRKLAYVSFEKGARGQSEIYLQEVETGKRELIASYPGHNGAPAFSPDGRYLAFVVSQLRETDRSNFDIFTYDLQSKLVKRVTNHWAIDTYPVWAPDGKSIVFTSDRSGRPQLYRHFLDGGREERLTFEGSENDRAVFSRDGKKIAMVHGNEGKYRIAVLEPETGDFRILTDGTLDESPSFAPNGSMIIYATNYRGQQVLSAVSVDGRVKQRIPSDEGIVREPAWSPFLKR